VIAPGKHTLHTLIPSLALQDGRPRLVFGTMGGDGQPQTHVQFYSRLAAGEDLQEAIDAPRWLVSAADGTVQIESTADPEVPAGLRRLGHQVEVLGPRENAMGHAHALRYEPEGYAGATDPRAEGAVLGW
jgi:gamma-glutamyltranspeptidase